MQFIFIAYFTSLYNNNQKKWKMKKKKKKKTEIKFNVLEANINNNTE